ncbi:MAG: hypothetical protein ACTSRZ_03920 [Promethearchaeota archaeon]
MDENLQILYSKFFALIFVLGFLYPISFLIRQLIKQFKVKNWIKIYNYFICVSIMLFDLYSMLILFSQIKYIKDEIWFWIYMLVLTIPIIILWVITFIWTIFYRIFGHPKKLEAYKEKRRNGYTRSVVVEDIKRKILHIIFYIGVWAGILIYGYLSSIYMQDLKYNALRWWEYDFDNPTKAYWFIEFIQEPSLKGFENAGFYHLFIIMFYVIFSYITLTLEALRHSKYLHSPFNKAITVFLRKEEIDGIATYFETTLSITAVSIVLPPILTMVIMGDALIGDMIASQIGIRFGKHKIPFNKKKSWEGLIAGGGTSFLLTAIFIGSNWGLIFASVFLIVDMLTEDVIKLSDNLLFPIVLGFICIILNYYAIPYPFAPFLNFFAP